MRGHKELIVWQKAMEMVTEIYRLTQNFPKEELYGLVSQMRRAAVSIPSNIAEGHGRQSKGEFRQFLGIARGSYAELETQIEIAKNLGFLANPNPIDEQLAEVGRLLNGLLRSLATDN
jgi:four helix bundle protein